MKDRELDARTLKGIRVTEGEAPKIEFPCQYPIKIMGEAHEDFAADVLTVVKRHAPEVTEDALAARASAKGNYLSVTVTIEATGKEQLDILFADLKTLTAVKLVL